MSRVIGSGIFATPGAMYVLQTTICSKTLDMDALHANLWEVCAQLAAWVSHLCSG
jgi:hypothetical protein